MSGRALGLASGSVSLALVLSIVFLSSYALGACPTNRSPHDNVARYVVTYGHVSNINGISSEILEYDPYYSAWNATGTNASVMLNYGTAKWAQMGWIKSTLNGGGSRRDIFVHMYLSSSNVFWQFWPPKSAGTTTWYEILYTWSATWDFFVNGTHYKQLNGSFLPEDYQVMGETHDWVDQMPGGTSAHVTYVNTQYFTGSPRQSTYVTSPIYTSASVYGGSNPSIGRYEIWDKACST